MEREIRVYVTPDDTIGVELVGINVDPTPGALDSRFCNLTTNEARALVNNIMTALLHTPSPSLARDGGPAPRALPAARTHWTQRPENATKVRKMAKASARTRKTK